MPKTGLLKPIKTLTLQSSPIFGGAWNTAISAAAVDGNILYAARRTVVQKYDLATCDLPLAMANANADHEDAGENDFLSVRHAHATGLVLYGDYIYLGCRGGGGGISNMAPGVTVGNLSILERKTLKKIGEIPYENKVTGVTLCGDLLIVSLHFHGFAVYSLKNPPVPTLLAEFVEAERPITANAREFQNCCVVRADKCEILLAFACYSYGIGVYRFDRIQNTITRTEEVSPRVIPGLFSKELHLINTVFGITVADGWVYGGLSLGNSRFYEKHNGIDWSDIDRCGLLYGPVGGLTDAYRLLRLPDEDRPGFIGEISGDPGPSHVTTIGKYVIFNLDMSGIGVARVQEDGSLFYLGRTGEDPEGRSMSRWIHAEGNTLYASYQSPFSDKKKPPLLRIFRLAES